MQVVKRQVAVSTLNIWNVMRKSSKKADQEELRYEGAPQRLRGLPTASDIQTSQLKLFPWFPSGLDLSA